MFQPFPADEVSVSCAVIAVGSARWHALHLATGVSVSLDTHEHNTSGLTRERLLLALARNVRAESSPSVLSADAYLPDKVGWAGWWPFCEAPCPSAEEQEQIRPLAAPAAEAVWKQLVGRGPHAMRLRVEDWPMQVDWRFLPAVEPDIVEGLPDAAVGAMLLPDDALVYFMASASTVVEANWGVFRAHPSCFELLADEGPILVAPGHAMALRLLPHPGVSVAARVLCG